MFKVRNYLKKIILNIYIFSNSPRRHTSTPKNSNAKPTPFFQKSKTTPRRNILPLAFPTKGSLVLRRESFFSNCTSFVLQNEGHTIWGRRTGTRPAASLGRGPLLRNKRACLCVLLYSSTCWTRAFIVGCWMFEFDFDLTF